MVVSYRECEAIIVRTPLSLLSFSVLALALLAVLAVPVFAACNTHVCTELQEITVCYGNDDGDGSARDLNSDDQITDEDRRCYLNNGGECSSCPPGFTGSKHLALQADTNLPELDCDDDDAERSPDMSEVCDGKDNDCDLIVDDGLSDCDVCVDDSTCGTGYVDCSSYSASDCPSVCTSTESCTYASCEYVSSSSDCGAGEISRSIISCSDSLILKGCDNFADACAAIDQYVCVDKASVSACPNGYIVESCTGSPECAQFNSESSCDSYEGCAWGDGYRTCYSDDDNDDYGVGSDTRMSDCFGACDYGYVPSSGDCDDSTSDASPGIAYEDDVSGGCSDGLDNDCDGPVDGADNDCCVCSSGACCDGCDYHSSSYVCDSSYSTDVRCYVGDLWNYHRERSCSGSSSSCSGSVSGWIRDDLVQACGSTSCSAPHTVGSCENSCSGGSCVSCSPSCSCEDGWYDANSDMSDGCEASCDADGDGFEGPQCGGPDCDDSSDCLAPGRVWYRDADGDGYVNRSDTWTSCSWPGSGWYARAGVCADE